MNEILQRQQEIIDEFQALAEDKELLLNHLIALGEDLPPLPKQYKTPAYEVPSCFSKVWIKAELKSGVLVLEADSNTTIIKGLVSLLIRIFSNQPPKSILSTPLVYFEKAGLSHFIGFQRTNGIRKVTTQIQQLAKKYL